MLSDITTWLSENGEYEAGLALLKATGYSGFALTILSMGEDAYNRQRLETELRSWQNKVSVQQDLPSPGPTMVTKQNSVPLTVAVDFAQPNQVVVVASPHQARQDAIQQEIYQLIRQRRQAKAFIQANEHLGNTDEACALRKPYAFQVKRLTRQIDELYSQIDFYKTYGYFPSMETNPEIDEQKALLNARSNVSRYKKRLEKKNLTPEQCQAYQAKYEEYLAEKNRLELKLNTAAKPT